MARSGTNPTDLAVTGDFTTDGLTDAELRATPVAVTGDFASDGLTDAELRATPVPVSGTVTANLAEPISVDDNGGSLTVDAPVTTPVFVRLSNGTIALIGQQLMAASLPVTLASNQSALPITDNAGSITVDGTVALDAATLTALESITVQNPSGASAVNIQDGGNSITVDGSVALDAATLAALESITVQNAAGASAVNIQDGGNSITVDGTVTADTELPAAAALADNEANPTVPRVGAMNMVYDGATWDRWTGAVTDGGGSLTVDGTVTANAGTGPWPVTDNAGSLTVDAPVGTPVFVRLSDGAATLIGQKAMAASLPVVLASDQASVPVANTETRPATGTITTTAGSASSVTLKASNASRRGLTIVNESSADLYVAFAATSTITAYTVLLSAGAYYEVPFPVYTGIVTGIWSSATGNARVTEIT